MIPRSPPARLLAGSTLLAWLAACGGGDDGVAPEPPPSVPVGAVIDLTVANLEPTVGTAVAVTAHVRTASGAPVEGVRIDFATGASSGSVSPAFSTTNAEGAAFTTWTVATVAGRQTLLARSGAVSDTTSVAVAPGPPASAIADGDTEHAATSGEALSVAVVVRDEYGNPVPAVPVVFEVLAGGGSASPGSAGTDSSGRASTAWTLGLEFGENRLAARAGKLKAVIFTATTGLFAIEEAIQERWPESDEITLRGRRLNLISRAAVMVNGVPPDGIAIVDSTQAVIWQKPLSGAQAEGCALNRTGQLTVTAPGVAFSTKVARWHGPLTTLEVGQELRFDSNQHCLRLGGESAARAQYVLATVDRSYIDAAQFVSEEWHYNGGTPFYLSLADSTGRASATAGLLARIQPPAPDPLARRPDHVRVHPPTTLQRREEVWSRTVPYEVGDEFDWYTGDNRNGTFRVMALYPPNVVLAVFEEDLPALWDDRRALAMDSLFQHLGSPEVQELYRTAFGDGPAQTSDATGQMLVMFHDGGDNNSTGVTYSAPNFRETTVHFRRFSYRDDNSWYYGLVAHELAHAWHHKAIGRASAVWSGEGIANWFADERLRLWAGLGLDANHDARAAIQGWQLRLPETGNFVAGYRESHSFLRFLVSRLVLDHGQSYASAARRVIWGTAEGWHGRHFINWDVAGRGDGLVSRMRRVVPEWDPVEARLDWMVSFALDDRSSLSGYRIPFVREASRHFGPSASFRLGTGNSVEGSLAGGGNYYFMVRGEGALHMSVPAGSTSDDGPAMAWKVVRWR